MKKLHNTRLIFLQVFGINLCISLAKLVCGFLTNTLSMVADGFHSILDTISNLIGIAGISTSLKPPDDKYPYGHKKFEALAAIAISFMMFTASLHVFTEVVDRYLEPEGKHPEVGLLSYVVIVGSIIVSYFVHKYEEKKAHELDSSLLEADAKHTLSDVLTSLAVVAALIGAQLKLYFVDGIASLAVVYFILKAGYEIIISHMGPLVDAAVHDTKTIAEIAIEVPGVVGVHKIRSRGAKDQSYIDMHIEVSGDLTVREGHLIASQVEQTLMQKLSGLAEVIVHLDEPQSETKFTEKSSDDPEETNSPV